MQLFTTPNASHREWTDHISYLIAVSDTCGGADSLVTDKIVNYADPSMIKTMLSRLIIHRNDFFTLVQRPGTVCEIDGVDNWVKQFGRDVINSVRPLKKQRDKFKTRIVNVDGDTQTCYKCGQTGNTKSICPSLKKNTSITSIMFAAGTGVGIQLKSIEFCTVNRDDTSERP